MSNNMGPRTPDNDMVICPNCTCQFVAIPVNVQARLAEMDARCMDYVQINERQATRFAEAEALLLWVRSLEERHERGPRVIVMEKLNAYFDLPGPADSASAGPGKSK
jgi:hypothetical protein